MSFRICVLASLLVAGSVTAVEKYSTTDLLKRQCVGGTANGITAEKRESADIYRVILDPRHRTKISSQVRAPVSRITKKLGESFKKDEILLELDDRVYRAQLEKAQAEQKRTTAEYESQQQLFSDGVTALTMLHQAEANATIAASEVAMSQVQLESCVIKAPYSGKIVDYMVEEHELADVGQDLVEIVDDEMLIARLLIIVRGDTHNLMGKQITITLDHRETPVTATITQVGSVIDPASGTLEIEATVDNTTGELTAGMAGTAHL